MRVFFIIMLLFLVSFMYPAAYDQVSPYPEVSFMYDGIKITAPREIGFKIVKAMILLDAIKVYGLVRNTHVKSIEIDYYPSEYTSHARAYCIKETKGIYFICDQNNRYTREGFLNLSYKDMAVSIMHECYHLSSNYDNSMSYAEEEKLAYKVGLKVKEMVADY